MEQFGVYLGEALAGYHFGEQHPFGPARHDAYREALLASKPASLRIMEPQACNDNDLCLFHTQAYINKVKALSISGQGYLDGGDTPARQGIYEAACTVVGSSLDAAKRIMTQELRAAFVPIAGLHHARRDNASGFCVFNDIGVVIEMLKRQYGLDKIAYIDIDAHHGDGVYYEFEADPCVIFADTHQDGRTLYPGTGDRSESGKGDALSFKLNIPLAPYANDNDFLSAWDEIEPFIEKHRPQFIILQAGADSLAGDPITQLALSEQSHAYAAKRLSSLAERYCQGRLLALGGGGYNLTNIAKAWYATTINLIN